MAIPAVPMPDGFIRPPSYVEVAGFKAIRDPAHVVLRPLTLLAGANSSGKSAVMQPILLLKQTLEAPFDPGPLLLNGTHAAFTRLDQFMSRGKSKSDLVRSVDISLGPITRATPRRAGVSPGKRDTPPVRLRFRPKSRTRLADGLQPVSVSVRTNGRWIELRDQLAREDMEALLAEFGYPHSATGEYHELPGEAQDAPDIRVQSDRFSVSIRLRWRPAGHRAHAIQPGSAGSVVAPVTAHMSWLASVLHLPGWRGHRERLFNATGVDTRSSRTTLQVQGPFTPYGASVIHQWQGPSERGRQRLAQVNGYLNRLGLTWKVHAKQINTAQVELKVGRMGEFARGGAHDLVDLADVGFGVSQVLPVVVAMVAAVPGQMVYIEQPELHLHPRAQVALGRILAETAARGVLLVVETHSKLVLRAVQLAVARSELRPEDVALHWFSRGEDGFASVTRAQLDRRGAFGDWPVDFGDVEAEVDDQWLEQAFGGDAA